MLFVIITAALAGILSVESTQSSRCDINDLYNPSHVSREETPRYTNSGRNLDVTCKEGYSPRYVTPYCLNGEWTRNSRSPCIENDCSVPEVEHGYIVEKIYGDWYWDYWKVRHVQEVNEKIVPNATLVAPSTEYHLRCDSGYSFQGARETERRLTCTKGNWLPAPVCIPSGTVWTPTQHAISTKWSNNVATSTMQETTPVSVTTESQKTSVSDVIQPEVVRTESPTTTEPVKCSCQYPMDDESLIATADGGQLHYLDKVEDGSVVVFRCLHVGYHRFSGPREMKCENCQNWDPSDFPSCSSPSHADCAEPPRIPYAKLEKTSTTHGSYAIYVFQDPYKLIGHVRVQCLFGEWIGIPRCNDEVTCEEPLPPERGSVQFSDGQAVGSIATYLCGEDTTLVGVSSSKCLENGVWTFDPPKCLRSCIIPEIENGVIGFHKTVQKYRQSDQEFVQFQVGETVKPGESVLLRCQHGFIPVNLTTSLNGDADDVWCRDGVWSMSMQCAPSKCLEEPPSIENGYPVVESNTNGSVIWYMCESGFEKVKEGYIHCVYGTWKGYTPVCGNTRCFINSLNYPGLILPTKEYLTSGTSFYMKCEEGYEKTSSKRKIRCFKGKWAVDSNPCAIRDQISMCSIENLLLSLPENVLPDLRNLTDDYVPYGTEIQFLCDSNSFVSGSQKAKCGRGGGWEFGVVRCIQRCVLGEISQQLLVEPIKEYYLFGELVNFKCPRRQTLSSEVRRVMCLGTSWSDPIPDCVEDIYWGK